VLNGESRYIVTDKLVGRRRVWIKEAYKARYSIRTSEKRRAGLVIANKGIGIGRCLMRLRERDPSCNVQVI